MLMQISPFRTGVLVSADVDVWPALPSLFLTYCGWPILSRSHPSKQKRLVGDPDAVCERVRIKNVGITKKLSAVRKTVTESLVTS